tara:strand:- start:130 stop:1113 length:984 start_codon:yes stop_codon:yes gene_type:complete
MKTKFAIGCLVQWYECNIIEEYVNSLKDALDQYKGQVIVDFTILGNQDLEKCISEEQLNKCIKQIKSICAGNLTTVGSINFGNIRYIDKLHTIADYRREFLEKYHSQVDILIQGESDALMPKQTFTVLDMLHEQVKDSTPKYIATFGINKMWDSSWKPLEHIEFTDKPFINNDEKNWWSIRYTMTKEEMDKFNDKIEDLNIVNIKPHKFNGCGLIISSEAVKAGVNIPKGAFFIDDTALQNMAHQLLPNMPQYHFKNILIVHNRKHPNKRSFILNEDTIDYIDDKRKSTDWYNVANEFCKINDANIFNPNHRFYTWDDVWKNINKNN